MAKRLAILSRHTGWQNVYGLRRDFAGNGYRVQSEVGCIDAPTSIAGGPVAIEEYSALRWAAERGINREA
ncbi:hypothetical protein [Denitromonas sp.]|uniref:hypothetical protein n=1 Tax=Denitromonas sp. TaxID=2734609 RepID=UPI003A8B9EEB